jgi:hypothetical protein
VQFDGGWEHAIAVLADGTALAWGDNAQGIVGDGTNVWRTGPVLIKNVAGVRSVAAGYRHSLALLSDGTVWSWGRNDYGQLSHTWTGALDQWEPEGVVGLPSGIIAIDTGDNHSIALARDGSVWTWGLNTSGQLGDGTSTNRPRPAKIAGFSLGDETWLTADTDGDGLSNSRELEFGFDPLNPDTNGDGISDGSAIAAGLSATNLDMDGDGLTNAIERERGLDPFRVDTDGDSVSDALDAFPLDPTRWQAPAADPNDHTPPVITLTEPTNARPVP